MLLQSGLLGPQTLPLLLVAAGIALSIAEALAPGAHFVVVGVSLLGAGLVGLLLGAAATPFVLAGLVLLIGVVTLYGYRELDIYGGKGQAQTSDSSDLKGQTARVTSRVTPQEGEVKIENGGFSPYYSARTIEGEIPEGEEVLVIDPGGGNVVTVESLGAVEGSLDRQIERARAENARKEAEEERPANVASDAESEDAAAADADDATTEGDDGETIPDDADTDDDSSGSGWTAREEAERETETETESE
ncbi:membrane protein implicated in regulation of membrane protease activity [Halolamina salifodinae]|uniref:Membrane protein implicated in regulation of membrane protease activity n=1 Tax=Halolamina salifodinae TaxID=1202767 RepID=A0A8T4GUW2_9EURY|nr:NfeD family protein [Halolamina salifodinae]MBP1985863.1 membrane protein implicated in regulation of membrane protease activity [Halolamina salifodinae]